ncbi:MAG: SDR family oxidoreductase [Planctomycetota bacterium]
MAVRRIALVTGASSGIGLEFARIHAAAGDDLVIVARRRDALETLKSELESQYGVCITVIVADLSDPAAPAEVFRAVNDLGLAVDCLVNNAGFGGHGLFYEREWEQDEAMIQLNVMALAELTRLFLPGMVERKHGKVLNVASTAGFLPGPLQAVYYATKAFVLSFSQAISEELNGTGVTVTALCPGPVDTGFVKAGNLEGVETFEQANSARTVAEIGYNAMQKGKLLVIDDWKLSVLLNWVMPFLPRKMVLRMSRQSMEKS